jgi:hypothetical protein
MPARVDVDRAAAQSQDISLKQPAFGLRNLRKRMATSKREASPSGRNLRVRLRDVAVCPRVVDRLLAVLPADPVVLGVRPSQNLLHTASPWTTSQGMSLDENFVTNAGVHLHPHSCSGKRCHSRRGLASQGPRAAPEVRKSGGSPTFAVDQSTNVVLAATKHPDQLPPRPGGLSGGGVLRLCRASSILEK